MGLTCSRVSDAKYGICTKQYRSLEAIHTSLHQRTVALLHKFAHEYVDSQQMWYRMQLYSMYYLPYGSGARCAFTESYLLFEATTDAMDVSWWTCPYTRHQKRVLCRMHAKSSLLSQDLVVTSLQECVSYYQIRDYILKQRVWTPAMVREVDMWFTIVYESMWGTT